MPISWGPTLMVDLALLLRRVAIADDPDLRNRALELAQLLGREPHVRSSQVLVQMGQLGRARDGDDPRLLGHHPRQGYLRRCGASGPAERVEHLDDSQIGPDRVRFEARQGVAIVVSGVEPGVLADRAAKKAPIERTVWHKADPELFEHREDLLLRLPPHQVVFALDGGHRLDGMGSADRLCADFAKAKPLNLALLDQIFHRAGDVFYRHFGVETMLIEEVN